MAFFMQKNDYRIKLCIVVKMPKKAKLKAEKSNIYFHAFPCVFDVYSRKVIREAREEISVPTPPILTPTRSGCQAVVNCESKIADGTLLMI